jgi:hypothetical protein
MHHERTYPPAMEVVLWCRVELTEKMCAKRSPPVYSGTYTPDLGAILKIGVELTEWICAVSMRFVWYQVGGLHSMFESLSLLICPLNSV